MPAWRGAFCIDERCGGRAGQNSNSTLADGTERRYMICKSCGLAFHLDGGEDEDDGYARQGLKVHVTPLVHKKHLGPGMLALFRLACEQGGIPWRE